MRPLEIAALVVLACAALTRFAPAATRPRWTRPLPWFALALFVVHAIVEGARWPLYPAYALALLLSLLAVRRVPEAAPRRSRRTVGRVVGALGALLIVGLSAVFAAGFPIFEYPPPSGPYGVGTTRLAFVDSARVDPFAPKPERRRELLANVWYPAEVEAGAPRAPFWPRDTDAEAAIGLPAFAFSHLALVPAHASPDAPMARAKARWPVIIYSHGFNSTPWQNVVQMEELASHGFVVVSLGHTYDASRLTFPDGHVVLDNSRTRKPMPSGEAQQEVARLSAKLDSVADPDSTRATWRHMEEYFAQVGVYVMPSTDVWYDDTRFLIDRLTAIDAGTDRETVGTRDRFAGRLDLERLGVAGMSFGGSTAGVTCIRDRRCKAGVNIDGWQFGQILDHPLQVPFLFMSREGNGQLPVFFGSSADLLHVEVRGTTHGSFADLAIAMPFFRWIALPNLALLGTTDGAIIERVMSRYLLAFFQRYLLDVPQPLLDAPSPPDDLRDATLTVVRPSTARPAPNAPSGPS